MRKLAVVIATVFAVLVFPAAAHAAVKFHSGPTFTDLGTTLRVTGNVSGLGTENLDVSLVASGLADVTCTNPAGNVAPGQRTETTTGGTVTGIEPKNGRATFTVITSEPVAPSGAEACPNSKWTASITDVDFTSATLTLVQGGQVIFSQTYPL